MRKLFTILASMLVATSLWAQSTSDIGKVLAADGKMYKTVAAATNAGTTASGIIAYWGSAGSVEAGNSSYRGMAIALADAALSWGDHHDHTNYCTSNDHQCSTATSYCGSVSAALSAKNGIAATQSAQGRNGEGHWHNAPLNGYDVARPSGASMWAIPSMGQWLLMAQGLTGNSSGLSDTDDNPDYHFNNLSTKINAAGGTYLEWLFYWSSTEKDASSVWCFNIGGLAYSRNGSRASYFAKNHDDQYMHVRMFFAFSSATAAVYTISYNANGGSSAPSAQTKDGGIDITLSNSTLTRAGFTHTGWNTNANGTGTHYDKGAIFTGNSNTTLYAEWTFQGAGTENNPYLIPSTEVWNFLADKVAAGNTYSGKFFRQTADISVTTMVGTGNHLDGGELKTEEFITFNGIYDGDGHTLNVNIDVVGERYVGPFHCVSGATIRNLIVTGYVSITGGSKTEARRHPSALIGCCTTGNVLIENCHVSANISGADYIGGLIGHSWDANVTIRGCVYSGTLTAEGNNYTGGFIGWGGDHGNVTFVLTNNLFVGSYSGSGKFHPMGFLCSVDNNTRTITNSYYKTTASVVANNDDKNIEKNLSNRCKLAYLATPATGVTIDPAGALTTYNVSGISTNGTGLKYNNAIYAANGETISLNLSGSVNYKASAGTFSGSGSARSLTMPASNVTIYGAAQFATTPSAKELTYSGTAQELVNAGSTADGTIEYKLDNGAWSSTIPSQTNYGTYTVSYHIVGDATHADNPGSSVSVTINKASLSITADNKSVTYGDAAPTYTATYSGWKNNETTSVLGGSLAFACEYSVGSDVDDYTITPSGLTATNYDITFVPGTLTVNKADAAVTTLPAAVEGLAYTGSAQTLISAGAAEGGEMQYKLDNGEYSTALPTATDVKVYTVYYKVVGDANHNNVEEASLEVTIGKPNYAISGNADPQHPDTYYSTFYYGLFKYLIPEGVEAYAATIGESDLYLKKIAGAGDVLPEGTAVILKSTTDQYTMVPSDASPISISVQNDLDGTDEQKSAPANCYVLSGHSTDNSVQGVGFYQYTGQLKAHRAYVVVGNSAPKRMRFVFDTETGVESVQSSEVSVQKIIRDAQLIIIRGDREFNVQGQIIK